MFKDRHEAGHRLAEKLAVYAGKDAVVLALPRGGIVTGAEIARALKLPLDILAVRKIGYPSDPEYAIGAIDEHGMVLWNEEETRTLPKTALDDEAKKEEAEAKRRSETYRAGRASFSLSGKIAILVDDGVATGLTMRLAVRAVKNQNPAKIVVATPIAPAEAIAELKEDGANEIIVLEPPETFMDAIGAHYEDFPQVEDAEVIRLLQDASAPAAPSDPLTTLRDRNAPTPVFRVAARELSETLLKTLHELLARKGVKDASVSLVIILRSGIALLEPTLARFPEARVGVLGIKRDEETFIAHAYYENLPSFTKDDTVVILDPMLATGGTAEAAVGMLEEKGAAPENIYFFGVIAATEGRDRLARRIPEDHIVVAAVDRELDARKYIVPGLGDFGDRYFGV